MAETISNPNAQSSATGYNAKDGNLWRVTVYRADAETFAEFFRYSDKSRAVARLADAWRAERDAMVQQAGELYARADALAKAINELEEK